MKHAHPIVKLPIVTLSMATLVACGGPQTAVPVGESAAPMAAAKSGDLLYIVNRGRSTEVEILTVPHGDRIGSLPKLGAPLNVCAGKSGTIWLLSYESRGGVRLYQFAHGGTKPIGTLKAPIRGANGCAVDPVSGDLALFSNEGISGNGEILVWKGARGKPTPYATTFETVAGAYDNKGNLFFDGIEGSDPFAFGELPKGGSRTHYVKIKHAGILFGSVVWDGTYITVEGGANPYVLDRLQISHFTAQVVQTIKLAEIPFQAWFSTDGATIVATKTSHDGRRIGIWNYPEGGPPTAILKGFHEPSGLTISRAGHRY